MAEAWADRYLALLGQPRSAPSRAALDALVRAHRSITFECVSSLIRRHAAGDGPVPPLDLEALLATWTARAGGGVCYEFGSMFGRLLAELGYVAYPVLAAISFPGSHSALMAEVDGRRLLVDVGNGQPIFEAIDVDEPFEIDRAGLRYRFHRDPASGRLVQDRWVGGEFRSFVTYDDDAASDDEMEASYQRHHAVPPRTFVMQNFRLVRCTDDEVIQLRDHEFTRFTAAGKTSEDVREPARYRELVAGEFGLPGLDADRGLTAWRAINGSAV
ncbi:MAG TPA: arylamine N-acetyltransferase [Candidatus Limnocylindrales bacterium]|nr:arylamine N-acetyltransferase [Candidatus Limnocylindrales bacterium]